jgi:hypothetical protein
MFLIHNKLTLTLMHWLVLILIASLLAACGRSDSVGSGISSNSGSATPVIQSVTASLTATTVTAETQNVATAISRPISTSSSTQPKRALGTTLGTIQLRANGGVVLQTLGEPEKRGVTHAVGSPEWEFTNGLIVNLGGLEENSPVRRITATPPFDGSTAEGFRLGDTKEQFMSIYEDFPVVDLTNRSQVQIDDGQGTYMNVQFDEDGKATYIILEDTNNP